ncbi:hypothetical protein AAVH_40963 [Aphelenchoides avenae]|nr:hypothetical protein AAVH_40963 [Aphelenchus avenae]
MALGTATRCFSRERPLTSRDVGMLCAAVLVLSAVAYAVFVWAASPAEAIAQENAWKLTSDPMWANDTPAFLAFTYGETKSNVLIAIMVLQGSMDFWCLVYTSYRIQQFLNEARKAMSMQTANMHSQMTRVLYGQAFIPFIALCMPVLGAFVSMMAGDFVHAQVNVTMICCMSTTAICVLNPVATIYFVPAYRNTVLAWVPFSGKKPSGRVTKIVVTGHSTHRYPTFSRRGL